MERKKKNLSQQETMQEIENRTYFFVLAKLIERAIKGKLISKPRKKFSKKQLDCTNAKGRRIGEFLKNPEHHFPAPNHDEMMERIYYIFVVLDRNKVDIKKEVEDIRNSLDPKEFPDAFDPDFFQIPSDKEVVQHLKKRIQQMMEEIEMYREKLKKIQAQKESDIPCLP